MDLLIRNIYLLEWYELGLVAVISAVILFLGIPSIVIDLISLMNENRRIKMEMEKHKKN